MRILVCVKRVPAPGAKINLTADAQDVDTAMLGFTTSPHEECAVEAAVQLVEQHGGASTVLTLGPTDAEEQLRYAASVGADSFVLLPIAGADWDPQATAAAILAAVRDLEDADGGFDLILFGNESADSGGYQVGIRVAHGLDRPMVNGIKGLELGSETDGELTTITARRDADAGQEIYQLRLPAVIGVKEGINLPRYPTMKGRLASRKAEIHSVEPAAHAGAQRLVELRQPPEQASNLVVLGHGPDAAPAVVDLLEEIGVLG